MQPIIITYRHKEIIDSAHMTVNEVYIIDSMRTTLFTKLQYLYSFIRSLLFEPILYFANSTVCAQNISLTEKPEKLTKTNSA